MKLAEIMRDEWARNAMQKQAEIVLSLMDEGIAYSTDQLTKKVNEQGRDWEPSHVLSSLRFLKASEKIVQKAGMTFQRKAVK